MYKHILWVSALVLGAGSLISCGERQVSFTKDVHPILSEHCLECHTKGKEGHKESGLTMETYAELMTGTKHGPVIEPGSSISSTLMRLIEHKADESINMPHDKNQIPADQIAVIKKWIDQGAKNN